MWWLGILIGFILGLPIGFIKWKKKPATVVEKYTRRGLIYKEFTITDKTTGEKSTVECNFEIGELESTNTLSKVEVIFVQSNQSEYNTDFNKKRLSDMVNNTWVNSSEITWITTTADTRNKKIDQVLN